jgi:Heterokaryon incompatibility protein (HET)
MYLPSNVTAAFQLAIERDGGQGWAKLAVTDSLMSALLHLRGDTKPRRLWFDAICINQSDHEEVGKQVRRMGDIYRLASRVVVCLGPSSDDSAHTISTLQHLGAQVELAHGTRFCSPDAVEEDWYRRAYPLPYSNETWDAILALLQLSWFSRLLIVQEIQLANTQPGAIMQCGSDMIEFSHFRQAIDAMEPKYGFRLTSFGAESSIYDQFWALLWIHV